MSLAAIRVDDLWHCIGRPGRTPQRRGAVRADERVQSQLPRRARPGGASLVSGGGACCSTTSSRVRSSRRRRRGCAAAPRSTRRRTSRRTCWRRRSRRSAPAKRPTRAPRERAAGTGWLVVAPDGEAAAKLAAELEVYLRREVPVLPARGVLYGADVAPAAHVVGERQQALAALAAGGVVVAEAVALLERFVPLELQPRPVAFAVGEEAPSGELRCDRLRRRRPPPRRPRLRAPRAPGPQPRRVRRARRPDRRLPVARRPAAHRVLGRRGREHPHLLGLLAAHVRVARRGDRLRRLRGRHRAARVQDRRAPGDRRLGDGGQGRGAGRALPARRRARPRRAGRGAS